MEFSKPKEIEITDREGNKHYEIAYSLAECHKLSKLHKGVAWKVLK